MSLYLVIGIYDDDGTRYADEYEAATPQEAEAMAEEQCPGLSVACVLEGELTAVRVVA